MNKDDDKKVKEFSEVYEKLSAPFPQEAIQRTEKEKTKKGYDTSGIGYQFCVDRFNEIFGDKWGFDWEIMKEREGTFSSGAPFFEIVVKMSIWVGNRENKRTCLGGHISMSYADAGKGAVTNSLKKTAAFWGVGRDAYAGTLDDDNKPLPESLDNVSTPETDRKKLYMRIFAQLGSLGINKDQGHDWINKKKNVKSMVDIPVEELKELIENFKWYEGKTKFIAQLKEEIEEALKPEAKKEGEKINGATVS